MLRHYYTLERISEEMKSLVGCKIIECFSQEKGTVDMLFYDGRDTASIHFSSDIAMGGIFMRKNFARARKNTADLFPGLPGDVLQDITIHPDDRIITFDFINSMMYAVIYGGARSNLMITDKKSIITDAFRNGNILKGTSPDLQGSQLIPFTTFPAGTQLVSALSACDVLLGKFYAEELCFRLNLDPFRRLSDLSDGKKDEIEEAAWKLRRECEASRKAYILMNNGAKKEVLSLIALNAYPDVLAEFDSINEAVRYRITRIIKNRNFDKSYKALSIQLDRLQEKLTNNIKLARDSSKSIERMEKYKYYGDLLMAQQDPKIKNGASIRLTGWDGNSVDIALDENKNLMQNAAKYFDKVRNTRESIKHKEVLLPAMEKRLVQVENALAELKRASSVKEIERIKDSVKHLISMNVISDDKEPSQKFREFDLGDGYMLYVGKSAANNDELTMKFAKQNDLWLHARGSAGSHAVLRMEKEEKPPKHILQMAASITAYYSQAKNAKYVPVCYTFRKYVRKPKGANPGSVTLSREEVIMAEPRLPG